MFFDVPVLQVDESIFLYKVVLQLEISTRGCLSTYYDLYFVSEINYTNDWSLFIKLLRFYTQRWCIKLKV